MWWTLLTAALAADIPFEPPQTVPLFAQVRSVSARASASGDACDEAMTMAVQALQEKAERAEVPVLLTVAVKKGDDGCKQNRTGDTVLQSAVALDGMAMAPAAGVPSIDASRVITIAASLGAAVGGLENARTQAVDGVPLALLPDAQLADVGGDEGARAARAFRELLVPAVPRWGPVLATVPELAGAALHVAGAGKGKKVEVFRFVVPTEAATMYLRGELTEDDLLASTMVTYAAPTKARDRAFGPLQGFGLEDAAARDATEVTARQDVDEADMEGLEDEEE